MNRGQMIFVPWAAAIIVVIATFLGIVRPADGRVRRALTHARDLTLRGAVLERRLRQQTEIRAAAKRVATEVRGIAHVTTTEAEGALLIAIAQAAARSGAGIVSVTPSTAHADDPHDGRYLHSGEIVIGIRGNYAAITLFVQYLCSAYPLLDVRGVHVSSGSRSSRVNSRLLDAVVDGRVYSVNKAALKAAGLP